MVMAEPQHPLVEVLDGLTTGRFPSVDGVVEALPPDPSGWWAIVALTGHAYVLSTHSQDAVDARGGDGFGGAMDPAVQTWLAGERGHLGVLDALLFARGRGRGSSLAVRDDLDDHPRVRRARAHRSDVRVLGDERGIAAIGHGLVGRTELAVELLDPTVQGRGAGRELITAALGEIGEGEVVWAQVSPGNAASLRAFLAAGFVPVGSEVLIDRRDADSI